MSGYGAFGGVCIPHHRMARLTRPTRLTVADRNTKKKTANRANRSESIREDSRDSSFFRLLYRPVTFNLMALNHYPAAYSAANFSTNSVYSPSSELQEIAPPHTFHAPFAEWQAQPRASIPTGGHKDFEDFFQLVSRNAGAVILDG